MIAALLALAQVAAAPAAPAPLPALPAPVTPAKGDARCLAAFGALGTSQDAQAQRASQLGALYFYGKLLGRDPAIDLKAAMIEAAHAVAPNVRGDLERCGAELQRSGEAMQAVGNAIGAATAPTPRPTPTPRR